MDEDTQALFNKAAGVAKNAATTMRKTAERQAELTKSIADTLEAIAGVLEKSTPPQASDDEQAAGRAEKLFTKIYNKTQDKDYKDYLSADMNWLLRHVDVLEQVWADLNGGKA